jgi:hypothetical protein
LGGGERDRQRTAAILAGHRNRAPLWYAADEVADLGAVSIRVSLEEAGEQLVAPLA